MILPDNKFLRHKEFCICLQEHRVEVGAQGMPILLSILEKDKPDQELVAATLEILCIVMSDSESVEAGKCCMRISSSV